MASSRPAVFREEAVRHAEGGGNGDVLRLARVDALDLLAPGRPLPRGLRLRRLRHALRVRERPRRRLGHGTPRRHRDAGGDGELDRGQARPARRARRGAGALLLGARRGRARAPPARVRSPAHQDDARPRRPRRPPGAHRPPHAKDLAASRVEQLSVRATQAGVIGDVRIRPGQLLAAGDTVVTLMGEQTKYSIVAMMPAQYRPQLKPGMSLRFEVTGYRYAYQEMTIASVSTQIIGPSEVKRYLGQQIDDTMVITGPVVLVEAVPPSSTFRSRRADLRFLSRHERRRRDPRPVREHPLLADTGPPDHLRWPAWLSLRPAKASSPASRRSRGSAAPSGGSPSSSSSPRPSAAWPAWPWCSAITAKRSGAKSCAPSSAPAATGPRPATSSTPLATTACAAAG